MCGSGLGPKVTSLRLLAWCQPFVTEFKSETTLLFFTRLLLTQSQTAVPLVKLPVLMPSRQRTPLSTFSTTVSTLPVVE